MTVESFGTAAKTMAPLLLAFIGPLAVTSAKHEPGTVGLASLLSVVLGAMTFNLRETSIDPSREPALLNDASTSLLATASSNRVVRLLLAVVYLHGAFGLSRRASTYAQEGPAAATGAGKASYAWTLGGAAGTFVLCYIAAMWGVSGYYGQ